MTDTTPTTRARHKPDTATIRRVVVALGLVAIAYFAFSLSFDAQTYLAIACGIDPAGAWRYPLVVDAAIVIVTLIVMWSDDNLARKVANYLYVAIAVWTATSVAGNALHILTLPAGRVTADEPIAIAVNTIPAVTLFLTIHIATITVFKRARPFTKPGKKTTALAAADGVMPRPVGRRQLARTDVPLISDADLMAMLDVEGASYSTVAAELGRSKSWVGEQVGRIRREREAAA